MIVEIPCKTQLLYRIDILRKGKIIPATSWRDNLITDAGLNAFFSGTSKLLAMTMQCILGTGTPVPVRRDSGAVTFTQSGSTITASSNFFESGDTGRLFKWGTGSSGNEVYLTYVNATTCTASVSATVSTPTVATIWYVNVSALTTPLSLSVTTEASSCSQSASTTGSVRTITCQHVLITSALASNSTITEIAFNVSTTNSNVFDRDIVSPTVALLAGDQARVTVQFIRNYSPITAVATGNVGTGCDTTGQMQIECLSAGVGQSSFISNYSNSSGGVAGGNGDANQSANYVGFYTGAITFSTYSDTTNSTARAMWIGTQAQLAYTNGNFYRENKGSLTISQGNGTIYGVALPGFVSSSGASVSSFVTWKFTTPFTKSSTQTIEATVRNSVTRILVN